MVDPNGKTVAAISVTGTIHQITQENLPVLSRELKATAAALTEALPMHAEHERCTRSMRSAERFSIQYPGRAEPAGAILH